jgi:uncharacterized repeat protein (TIGR03803 family)
MTEPRHQGGISTMREKTSAALTLALFFTLSVAMNRSAQAQTFNVLYIFKGGHRDGGTPYAGVIRDSAGNLYGTTAFGGRFKNGTVFILDKSRKETVLNTFTGKANGGVPYFGSLLRDAAGNLYGTTLSGGPSDAGVVFKVDPTGKETVLHTFLVHTGDGASPVAGLIRDGKGNLYGTTQIGGAFTSGCQGLGCGTVFRLTATGKEKVLYSFSGGVDGSRPCTALVRDKQGNLYGTTSEGGAYGSGAVFKLDEKGNETVLYSFGETGMDGSGPGGLILDSDGNLYGATFLGGLFGWGTVFRIDSAGKETILYSFAGSPDGAEPYGGLVRDAQGNLYGTASSGGASQWGTVFKINKNGEETILHSFTFATDGGSPHGDLIRDNRGTLYGTNSQGGPNFGERCNGLGCGTVFRLIP